MNQESPTGPPGYPRPHDPWQCSLEETMPCGGNGRHLPSQGTCVPVPSLRLQRGIFAASCTALVAGLLLAAGTGPWWHKLLAPGPLTDSHARILDHQGGDRCGACHGAADGSLAGWIRDTITAGRQFPVSQSRLCLDCHGQELAAEYAMLAHNLPTSELSSLTANTVSGKNLFGSADPRNSAGELACATCHREHHGADFNLTTLTDQQCQVCHVNHVHRFEQDHPEFRQWPFARRTGIAFDHVSHARKHFVESDEPFDCRHCHIDDSHGNVKLVAPFAISCAKCHESEISGDQVPAWTLLQLPMLDTEALSRAGHSIGLWPESCDGDFDGTLPPAMRLLLMSDARIAEILQQRGEDFSFADLDPDNTRDLAEAAELAWSIKDLLFGLSVHGRHEIRNRLQASLTTSLDLHDFRQLTRGLHAAVFAQTLQHWMPGLSREMTLREADIQFPVSAGIGQIFPRPGFQDDDTLAVNPLTGLFGDREMQSIPSASSQATVDTDPDSIGSTRQAEEGAVNLRITGSSSPSQPAGTIDQHIRNRFARDRQDKRTLPITAAGDLLAANPLTQRNPRRIEDVAPQTDPVPPVTGTPQPDPAKAIRAAVERIPDDEAGGWFRNDTTFSLSWRPGEHTDPLIKSWTGLAMKYHSRAAMQQSGMFAALNSPLSPGGCRNCHTVDQQTDGSLTINWSPRYRDVSRRGFTRFSHRPHNIQSGMLDCHNCHRLEESGSSRDALAGLDPWQSCSDFQPLAVADCASCHRAGGAPAACVDCHYYHVGSQRPDTVQ
jgi:hypothetical protein